MYRNDDSKTHTPPGHNAKPPTAPLLHSSPRQPCSKDETAAKCPNVDKMNTLGRRWSRSSQTSALLHSCAKPRLMPSKFNHFPTPPRPRARPPTHDQRPLLSFHNTTSKTHKGWHRGATKGKQFGPPKACCKPAYQIKHHKTSRAKTSCRLPR